VSIGSASAAAVNSVLLMELLMIAMVVFPFVSARRL
jgi:hypothetical protein